jgi:glycosyltransferase involved in cell wall biosynthesis
MPEAKPTSAAVSTSRCRVVVIWIDWYAYHVARFEGLQEAFGHAGEVAGIELVGGVGVHAGLKFCEDRQAHLPIETLRPESSWRDANKLALARTLWRRLDELHPEIVLVPGYYTLPALAAAVWARTHGSCSVLMTESTAGDHVRTGWKEWLKSKLVRALFNWAVVGGAAHLRYIRRLGIAEERTARFYDVVGNDAIREGTTELRLTSSREEHGLPHRYFLFIGRLAPEKNVAGLLQAWLDYRRDGGDLSLVLAGGGPEASGLRARVEASPFARDVVFTGLKSSRELLPLLAFASCFVLPSTREPWGLVVNEAMAAGLPVIVSKRCGCAEDLVENGRNGLIFDPEHGAELTACLERLAQLSDAERAAMGQRSAEKINLYSPHNFGLQIASIADAKAKLMAEPADSRPEAAA